jgi:hypothetical protein
MACASDDVIIIGAEEDLGHNYNMTDTEKSKVYVYDPDTGNCTVLNNNEVAFSAFSVNDAETVTFTGKRLSDGMGVIGEIDSAGNLSILKEGTEVAFIEEVNH